MKCFFGLLNAALILLSITASSPSYAATTAEFMNAMTVCAAGSTITIDADLQGSMTSLFEKENTKGRATQQVVTEVGKLLPQQEIYKEYLRCVVSLLGN